MHMSCFKKQSSHIRALLINQNVLICKKTTRETTYTHTHTLSGRRRSIHDGIYRQRTCDIYCGDPAASRPLRRLLREEFPCGCERKQSVHQTGCTLTVCTWHQDLCPCLSLLVFLHKCSQPRSVHPSDVVLFVRLRDQSPCRKTQTLSDWRIENMKTGFTQCSAAIKLL